MNIKKQSRYLPVVIVMLCLAGSQHYAQGSVCSKASSPVRLKKSDVFRTRQETIQMQNDSSTNTVWAVRLDFLSALKRIALNAVGDVGPDLVMYNDPNAGGQATIGGQAIGAASVVPNVSPAVSVISSEDGSIPTSARWGDTSQNSPTELKNDGTGLSKLQRGHFTTSTGYLALGNDVEQQRKLWIVPNVDGTTGSMSPGAQTIFTEISMAMSNIPDSVNEVMQRYYATVCPKKDIKIPAQVLEQKHAALVNKDNRVIGTAQIKADVDWKIFQDQRLIPSPTVNIGDIYDPKTEAFSRPLTKAVKERKNRAVIVNSDNKVINAIALEPGTTTWKPPKGHIAIHNSEANAGDIYDPKTNSFSRPIPAI